MINHSRPTIVNKKQIIKQIKKILDSGYLAENKFVEKFEKELCKIFNTKYAVCVSSGTAGLFLSLLSLNVEKNSEVIIPAYTCSAVLNAVIYTQAKPVIVDVNSDDFSISYAEIKNNISKKTKAIIVPHMFGYPAKEIKKIITLGIPVIEDTTQSVGAKIDNTMVGSFGITNVISFYATKMMTTFGEGGAILTNDKKIWEFLKDIKEYDKKLKFKLRYNYKMSEIQAIMGLNQLKNLDKFVDKRRKIFEYYKNKLKNCNIIKIFKEQKNTKAVYYRFIIQLNKKFLLDQIIQKYKKFGIEVARPVYLPLDKYYLNKFFCKNSKLLYETTLSLPIYPSLKEVDVEHIVDVTQKLIC
ncbi:MAG: DegT/DnrJ/EryC1/StrS family aminotransferase [Endomicrobiia bacterium]